MELINDLHFGPGLFDAASPSGGALPARQMSLWSTVSDEDDGGRDSADAIVEACLGFGWETRGGAEEIFAGRYEEFVRTAGLDRRVRTVIRVAEAAEAGEGSALSLLPFILADPARQVIHTAALEATLLVPMADGDPLTGPRTLLAFADTFSAGHARAGILGGLLLLGDRRILPLIREERWRLAPAGRSMLMEAWSGYALAAQIDFLVDWLEDAPEYDFGGIVAALAAIPERASHSAVIDVERRFPRRCGDDDGPPLIITARWSIEEYAAILAPRLLDLHRRETPPRTLQLALDAWGIRR